MHVLTRSIVLASLAAGLTAQRELDARSFLPELYDFEVRIEFAELFDSGIWDPFERSLALRLVMSRIRSEFGFDIADLDRFRFLQRTAVGELPPVAAWIFEGSKRIHADDLSDELLKRYRRESAGDVEWFVDADEEEIVSPRPGVVAMSESGFIGRVVRGEERGGLPQPDLVALTAGRHTLAMAAVLLPPVDHLGGLIPIPDDWLVKSDRIEALRLRLVWDPEADAASLELFARFANGQAGPAHFEKKLVDGPGELQRLGPPASGFAPMLDGLKTQVDGRNLVATLPLGTADAAGGKLQSAWLSGVPVLLFTSGDAPAKPLMVAPEAVAEPHEHGRERHDKSDPVSPAAGRAPTRSS